MTDRPLCVLGAVCGLVVPVKVGGSPARMECSGFALVEVDCGGVRPAEALRIENVGGKPVCRAAMDVVFGGGRATLFYCNAAVVGLHGLGFVLLLIVYFVYGWFVHAFGVGSRGTSSCHCISACIFGVFCYTFSP